MPGWKLRSAAGMANRTTAIIDMIASSNLRRRPMTHRPMNSTPRARAHMTKVTSREKNFADGARLTLNLMSMMSVPPVSPAVASTTV